jgi:Ca2+:H+ antiporter
MLKFEEVTIKTIPMSLTKITPGRPLPLWTYLVPILAAACYAIAHFFHLDSGLFYIVMGLALVGSVLAAVSHAEVIALQIGEPLGSVVLAVSVTIIEVAMIVSLTFSKMPAEIFLPRDTVFAAVMIILNAMVGLSILIGSIKFREQQFTLQGVSSSLTILVAISMLTLILPNYTKAVPGPSYSTGQLIFVAVVTLLLYGTFLVTQNFTYKEHFLDAHQPQEENETEKPGPKITWYSFFTLLVCLATVVGLAENLEPTVQTGLDSLGAPHSLVGILIATVVLLPEGISATNAALNNHLQKSLNLTLGSALASIGLTIPTVSLIAVLTGTPMGLGLDPTSTVLFFISLLVIMLSLSTGRTSTLQGIVLLIIFSVYIFLTISP